MLEAVLDRAEVAARAIDTFLIASSMSASDMSPTARRRRSRRLTADELGDRRRRRADRVRSVVLIVSSVVGADLERDTVPDAVEQRDAVELRLSTGCP